MLPRSPGLLHFHLLLKLKTTTDGGFGLCDILWMCVISCVFISVSNSMNSVHLNIESLEEGLMKNVPYSNSFLEQVDSLAEE